MLLRRLINSSKKFPCRNLRGFSNQCENPIPSAGSRRVTPKDLEFVERVNACTSSTRLTSSLALRDYLNKMYEDRDTLGVMPKLEKILDLIMADKNNFLRDIKCSNYISLGDGRFLYSLIRSIKPKRVLELGSYVGKSTNIMLCGMEPETYISRQINSLPKFYPQAKASTRYTVPADQIAPIGPTLLSCDVDDHAIQLCTHYTKYFGSPSIYTCVKNFPALKLIDLYPENERFDFIFVDCDRTRYKRLYQTILEKRLLSNTGLMIFADCLNSGDVSSFSYPTRNSIEGKSIFNKAYAVNEYLYGFCFQVAECNKSVSTMLPYMRGMVAVQPLYK